MASNNEKTSWDYLYFHEREEFFRKAEKLHFLGYDRTVSVEELAKRIHLKQNEKKDLH